MMRTPLLMIISVLCFWAGNLAIAQEPAKTPVKTASKQSFDDFSVIVNTNIFIRRKNPSKNDHANDDADQTAKPAAPTPVINTYLLYGIILENDDQFTAMFEHTQTHTLKSTHVGDKLDVFDISSMSMSSVIFTLPDGRTVEQFVGQTVDANGHIQQATGWQASSPSTTSTPAVSAEKELSILEKLRRKRESQLNKDQP
jgi:hypothetical protein